MKTTTAIIVIVVLAAVGYGLWSMKVKTDDTLPSATTTPITSSSNDSMDTASTNNEWNMSASGLGIKIVKEGTRAPAAVGDSVSIDYTGTLEDGTVFDSSEGRAPLNFTLGQGRVIAGWEQGILGMQVGEERQLDIPADLAYGAQGYPPVIPPNATLRFDVKLVAIQ
jgi:FKBP-type peptidyl-prolyl cis-trans isomerase